MSQLEALSPSGTSEPRYELRRRRVRRRRRAQREEEQYPRDPRFLRAAACAFFTGVVLVVLLLCSGGSGGVGTPTVSVGGGGSVAVGNHTATPMSVGVWSVNTLSFGTGTVDPGGTIEISGLPGRGSQFVIMLGKSRGVWPLHFWIGIVDGPRSDY